MLSVFRRAALLGKKALGVGPVDADWDKVSLLMHMNGNPGATSFKDETGQVWSTVGNVVVSNANYALGGASAYFSGAGGFLTCGAVPDKLQIGGGDFTIEFFINLADTTPQLILGNLLDNTGSGHFWLMVNPTYQGLHTFGFGTPNGNIRFGSTTFPTNVTKHVAISRKGTEVKCFIDGVQYGATGTLNNFTGTYTNPFRIGGSSDSTPHYPLNGYLDELRVTKGLARYTENFTPPTTEFGNTAGVDPHWDSVILLSSFDGEYDDSSKYKRKATTAGSRAFSTTAKFGGYSLYTGTNSSGSVAYDHSADFALTGDYTIEFFYRLEKKPPGSAYLFCKMNCGMWLNDSYATFYTENPNAFSMYVSNTPELNAIGVWNHIAITCKDKVHRIFVNGVLKATTSSPGSPLISTSGSLVLANSMPGSVGGAVPGWLDEFRITKGVARYTENFTPLTAPYKRG